MKVLYDYTPNATGTDATVTITQIDGGNNPVSSLTGFPVENLKLIEPIKSWKSADITHAVYIQYDFGSQKTINSFFLNRFNFAAFQLFKRDSAVGVWEAVKKIGGTVDAAYTGLTKDEIYDENYMHIFDEIVFSNQYLGLYIPNNQTPIFEQSYFKVGNFLVGNCIEVWNPKPGYSVEVVPRNEDTTYDSGYRRSYKLGRSIRVFNGQFDKCNPTEYAKFRQSLLTPFVLHHEWEASGDRTKAYLVRQSKGGSRTYDYTSVISGAYTYEELA